MELPDAFKSEPESQKWLEQLFEDSFLREDRLFMQPDNNGWVTIGRTDSFMESEDCWRMWDLAAGEKQEDQPTK